MKTRKRLSSIYYTYVLQRKIILNVLCKKLKKFSSALKGLFAIKEVNFLDHRAYNIFQN